MLSSSLPLVLALVAVITKLPEITVALNVPLISMKLPEPSVR